LTGPDIAAAQSASSQRDDSQPIRLDQLQTQVSKARKDQDVIALLSLSALARNRADVAKAIAPATSDQLLDEAAAAAQKKSVSAPLAKLISDNYKSAKQESKGVAFASSLPKTEKVAYICGEYYDYVCNAYGCFYRRFPVWCY
jgi:hypothetical protein